MDTREICYGRRPGHHASFASANSSIELTFLGPKFILGVNLLYGLGSTAWSITLTQTYQYKKFFTRTDISYVSAGNVTPGYGFGTYGLKTSQTRGVVELGFLF